MEGKGEEMDRHAYKVKLQLTSKKAWHHHLTPWKSASLPSSGQTTDAWQTLAVRRPTSKAWQAELSSLYWDLCCSRVWVAVGRADGFLNGFSLFCSASHSCSGSLSFPCYGPGCHLGTFQSSSVCTFNQAPVLICLFSVGCL